MIIISQNGKRITDNMNLNINSTWNGNTNEYAIYVERTVLGIYSTEERAKEILQEIKNKYKYGTTRVQIETCKWVEENPIYEMPKE